MEKKKFSELSKKEKMNVIIFLGIIVFIAYLIFKPSSENTELLSEKYSKFEALFESRQFVEKRLKAPSTADFSNEIEKSVKKINDTTFTVNGYVDSENSFGAKLRNNYSCKIIFLDKLDKVRCEDLIIK